jgi:hypothetical protein
MLAPSTRKNAGTPVSRWAPLGIPSLDQEWQHVDVGELLKQPKLDRIALPQSPPLGRAPAFAAAARFLRIPLLQWHHYFSSTRGRLHNQEQPCRSSEIRKYYYIFMTAPSGKNRKVGVVGLIKNCTHDAPKLCFRSGGHCELAEPSTATDATSASR